MSTMSSFCRITGHARNLPKPCYFPLLPPISPADAKKLCRITGRATDAHHYSPIIAFGKPYRFDGLEGCRITQHENLTFVRPTFVKNKENEKAIDSLNDILNIKKKNVDPSKAFVYKIPEQEKSIVLPPELEEAIRIGLIETLSVSKDGGHINIKLKHGRLIKIQLEPFPADEVSVVQETFYNGEGQNKEVLEEQQIIINQRNERKQATMARKKLFEQKEKKAEHDEKKDTERPASKRPIVRFDPLKKKAKMENMVKIIEENAQNKEIILPKLGTGSEDLTDEQIWYEKMLEDIASAQKKSVNVMTYINSNFDWNEVALSDAGSFDWSAFPNHDQIELVDIGAKEFAKEGVITPAGVQAMDIAAVVETITPAPKVKDEIIKALSYINEDNLKATGDLPNILKKLESENLMPTLDQISEVVSNKNNIPGYLVEKEGKGAQFVKKEEYVPGKEIALSGAMVMIENVPKFVSGQIIHLAEQETFVAGQTIETSKGKRFIPGQTVVADNGIVKFFPGHCVSNEEGENIFVGGRIVESKDDGHKFVAGQMVDRGDKNPVFMSGQTVMTSEGPKFIPGEIILNKYGEEEFVPGIKLPTDQGEKFVPGQAFSKKEGLAFTPGQIVSTSEGPSFIPGTSIETPEGGKKFIPGNIVKSEDGKIKFEKKLCIPTIQEDLIIPNEDLNIVKIKGKGIVGFAVNPSNTANVQAGEKLYGDIVENETSVMFYLSGKLPVDISANAKIISGELHVDVLSQRFIPGKLMNTSNGEKFIPGQLVRTNHGEEFVPGQIVETSDGPKFVPGQVVMTSEGEKFVPGQVLMEEDGPRFVPGQIIQTKNGATFIPGQMMNTDEGQKFVPGQLVDTKDGPRFVPGQVLETNEGPKFVPGTVVETEEGLKYVPNNADDTEEDSEISFQGFEVSPEELQLISSNLPETRPHSPITRQQSLIDSDTLKKLAVDTMVIHGRTPEPYSEKKKKKKRGKVAIDALEEDNEEEDVETVDPGRNKVDVLNHLIKADSALSTIRRDRELLKVAEITGSNGECESSIETEIAAIKFLLSAGSKDGDLISTYIGDDEQLISEILKAIDDVENLERNDQVQTALKDTLRDVVTKRCDKQITNLIEKISENPESLFTDPQIQILLTEAVGIVCVTGDVEVASLLEKFISEPSNPNCLKDDKDVLAVLRQLLVLHRIAERDSEVEKILKELQSDPEGVKDRNKIRKLIKKAKTFFKKEKPKGKTFDIRHVASSKDIPKEVFQQLKEDKKEAEKFIQELPDELFRVIMGDDRCGGKFLESLDSKKAYKAQKELERFKKGMAIVVTKENMQAVIPRHYARSVCYGIMPYVLIDEEGFKFFERGLTGRKLAPSRVIENTWFQPIKDVYPKRVMAPEMQYNMMFLGDSYNKSSSTPSLQYTCLLPSAGPTRVSLAENQRRASRDMTPLRRSLTPSRRFSSSSIHDHLNGISDNYSRRNSLATNTYGVSRCLSPSDSAIDLSEYSVNSYVPCTSYLAIEDAPDVPVARSGTVGKLLDKYSKFSLAKEFGYHNPVGTYNKYNSCPSKLSEEEDEVDESYVGNDKSYLPSTYSYRSSLTPDKHDNVKQDVEPTTISHRSYQRPFSNIYEADETVSPTSAKSSDYQNSFLDSLHKKYGTYANSDSDSEEPSVKTPKVRSSSYDYLHKNGIDEPSKSSRYSNRLKEYKSLTEDDDGDDEMPTYGSYLRKKYSAPASISVKDDDGVGSIGRKYKPKVAKPSRFLRKSGQNDLGDEDESGLVKKRQYGGSRSDTFKLGSRFGKPEINGIDQQPRRRKTYGDPPGDLRGSLQSEDDTTSDGNGDESYVARRPYGDQVGRYGGGGYTAPYGSQMYENPYLSRSNYAANTLPYSSGTPYNNYGGPMGSYGAPMGSYGGPMGSYGAPLGYNGAPMTSYNSQIGAYGTPMGSYRAPSLSTYTGGIPYSLPKRRMTSNIPCLDDDDDDDADIEIYDPKKEQRSLAAQIAKKYNFERDQDPEE